MHIIPYVLSIKEKSIFPNKQNKFINTKIKKCFLFVFAYNFNFSFLIKFLLLKTIFYIVVIIYINVFSQQHNGFIF